MRRGRTHRRTPALARRGRRQTTVVERRKKRLDEGRGIAAHRLDRRMTLVIEIADIDADQASLEGLAIRGIDVGLGETRAHREHEVRLGEQALGRCIGQ
jgi:hypothetical protein